MRHLARFERRRSRLTVWSRRLGVFSVVVAVLAIMLNRADAIDPLAAVAALVVASSVACLAVVAGVGGIVRIWQRGHLGLWSALAGLVLGGCVLAAPTYLAIQAAGKPMINDVATDWSDPPEMRAAILDRSRMANPVRRPTTEQIDEQAAAYPEIGPLVLAVPSQRVYEASRFLADARGWKILEAAPPDELGPGRLEMVARTPVLGFRDDVVVVVTNLGQGRTRVDMRSASRFGGHDFGKNAKRIYAFLTELDTTLKSGTTF